ncbi:hypothetical protein OBBRIDRAFT_791940 [Obba rivulosa]|uniref:Uncharacterized protein n=1 Tax=Obba rivulosa TaxID=1052685 RepID=A0A8E2AW73_9APHY|nr:hypothetical protein OBBRIDRAFT_791940 [Obba rivulosa]
MPNGVKLPVLAGCLLGARRLGCIAPPSRGHIPIVLVQLERVRNTSNDPRYKFRIVKCGMFRITEIMSDVEEILSLEPGEGRAHVDGHFTEADAVDAKDARAPVLVLMASDSHSCLQPYIKLYSQSLRNLQEIPYNPNWRGIVNQGAPLEPLRLRSGVKDAEHIF